MTLGEVENTLRDATRQVWADQTASSRASRFACLTDSGYFPALASVVGIDDGLSSGSGWMPIPRRVHDVVANNDVRKATGASGVFILDSLLGWFSVDMGIDLGTCNTLVCVKGEGIILNEPSVVAVKKGTNRVLQNGEAVGLVAKEMLGKTPGSIQSTLR